MRSEKAATAPSYAARWSLGDREDRERLVSDGWRKLAGRFKRAHRRAVPDPKWTKRAPMLALAARRGADGLIYAIGGANFDLDGDTIGLTTVEAYDPATNAWTTEPPLPTARYALAAALGNGGALYAIGGRQIEHEDACCLVTAEARSP